MRVDALRKMPKPVIQRIADEIVRVLGMKVETRFAKGDFIEIAGKLKQGSEEKKFVLVVHTGNLLPDEFLTAFRKALKKENAEAVVLTLGGIETETHDEHIRIVAGDAVGELVEKLGIELPEEKPEILDLKEVAPQTQTEKRDGGETQSSLPSAGTLEKYMKMGVKLFERKEYEKAIQYFDDALRLKPGYDRAIGLKARAYAAMGKKDLALEIYRRALEQMPDKYELWYEMADLLHTMERFDEELECYTKILENNKKLDNVWNNMGIVYFLKGKYEDALFCFERANKLKPGTPDYLNNLATVQKKLGKHEEALATYRKVLEIAPDYTDVLLNMGLLYNEMEKHEEAYRTFRKYLLKEKNSPKGWHLAGIAAMNAGAYSQAIKCFEEALKIKPDLKESREGLREAKRKFSQKGDKQKISEVEETRMLGGGVSRSEETQPVTQKMEEKPSEAPETEVRERDGEETEMLKPGEKAEEKKREKKEETDGPSEKEREPLIAPAEKKEEPAKSGLAALVSAIAKETLGSEEGHEKEAPKVPENISEIWALVKNGEFERAAKNLAGKDVKKKTDVALIAGIANAGSGSFKEASECFDTVLAQQKMHLPALFGKEFAAFSLGDLDTALKTLDLLSKKFPASPSLMLKKCLLLYAKKQFDECETELKKIAREMQHSELYWFILGSVNQQKGQKENARKCFENALKINPGFAAARKKIEEMER
ncbi:MAG: tetratricopeptide repeat protein [Thermoplasmata archaeon]|nr:tetratricopeptide repeat protein [Thermoplasmata archaeon]